MSKALSLLEYPFSIGCVLAVVGLLRFHIYPKKEQRLRVADVRRAAFQAFNAVELPAGAITFL